MTLQTLPSPIIWPGLAQGQGFSPGSGSTGTLSASGHYVSYVFCARESMTLSHVAFRTITVANSPTVEVRIETVDTTTGLPTGTLWATNTNVTSGVLSSNTNVIAALTASATITKGQIFCVKFLWGAVATSTLQIGNNSATNLFGSALPYQVINTGSVTKGGLGTNMPNIALGNSATTFYYVPGCFPITTNANGAFNNTNSAKRGIKFTVPFKCRVIGIRWYNANSVGDFNAVLYDNQGTPAELGSSSTFYEGDATAAANGVVSAYFDNAVTMNAGDTGRAVIEPTTATNVTVGTFTLHSADFYGSWPGGATATYTTFATATWTDSTTQLPFMDILIDQLDDGASVSGVVGVIGG